MTFLINKFEKLQKIIFLFLLHRTLYQQTIPLQSIPIYE